MLALYNIKHVLLAKALSVNFNAERQTALDVLMLSILKY